MLLNARRQTIDKNHDGELTVFELGKAISEDHALLKVLAGTGHMRPSAEDALKARLQLWDGILVQFPGSARVAQAG